LGPNSGTGAATVWVVAVATDATRKNTQFDAKDIGSPNLPVVALHPRARAMFTAWLLYQKSGLPAFGTAESLLYSSGFSAQKRASIAAHR
jgi:hypothetical protein